MQVPQGELAGTGVCGGAGVIQDEQVKTIYSRSLDFMGEAQRVWCDYESAHARIGAGGSDACRR